MVFLGGANGPYKPAKPEPLVLLTSLQNPTLQSDISQSDDRKPEHVQVFSDKLVLKNSLQHHQWEILKL